MVNPTISAAAASRVSPFALAEVRVKCENRGAVPALGLRQTRLKPEKGAPPPSVVKWGGVLGDTGLTETITELPLSRSAYDMRAAVTRQAAQRVQHRVAVHSMCVAMGE
jgi:hypothetical protein